MHGPVIYNKSKEWERSRQVSRQAMMSSCRTEHVIDIDSSISIADVIDHHLDCFCYNGVPRSRCKEVIPQTTSSTSRSTRLRGAVILFSIKIDSL
jgi:hypothetical protein